MSACWIVNYSETLLYVILQSMPEKFKDRYRIPSARHPYWDYGADGYYFVTICTQQMECFFGRVKDGKMYLSDTGQIAHDYWLEIPKHFPFIRLESFIVMPNHVHGILVIDKKENKVGTDNKAELAGGRDAINRVSTGGITGVKNPMLHDSLPRVIRWYKGRVSFESHKTRPGFKWQARFHDHIIRDEKAFYRISEYIQNNPLTWGKDKFYVVY